MVVQGWWCRDDINRPVPELEKSGQQKHTWFEKEVSWSLKDGGAGNVVQR